MVRGARGTLPACGRDFLRYGGNTSCFTVESEDSLLIIDAGTGLTSVSRELVERNSIPSIFWLLTHLHMDHLIGLPAFAPLYRDEVSVVFMADGERKGDWKSQLAQFMAQPYWPVRLYESGAGIRLQDLPPSTQPSMECCGLLISWCRVPHPQGCVAYRIQGRKRTVLLATDAEFDPDVLPADFIAFARGVDHLFLDAQYDPIEYESHRGWGHGSWQCAVEVALRAGVGELILTHHAPDRRDAEIDWIVEQAAKRFSRTRAAWEGMRVELDD